VETQQNDGGGGDDGDSEEDVDAEALVLLWSAADKDLFEAGFSQHSAQLRLPLRLRQEVQTLPRRHRNAEGLTGPLIAIPIPACAGMDG
jgi:hypothetical protein